LSIFVKPALNRGLKPVGLLVAVCCSSVLRFSGASGAIAGVCCVSESSFFCSAFTTSSDLTSAFGAACGACSEVSVFVTPALNLGLNPVGLLATGSWVSELLFSGSAFIVVSELISPIGAACGACSEVSIFVTPDLNLGLNPVGFGADGVALSVVSSDAGVVAAVSGGLVTPALNRGLNPVGLLATGSWVSELLFSGSAFIVVSELILSIGAACGACSEVSVFVTPALNLGLNPVGFGADGVVSSVVSSDTGVLAAVSGALVTPALNLGLNPVGFGADRVVSSVVS